MNLIIENDNGTITRIVTNLKEFDLHKAFAKAYIMQRIHDAVCEECDE